MRHLSVTFPLLDRATDTVYSRLVPHAPGRRASLYNLNVMDDGTTVELVSVEGDLDRILAELADRENLLEFEVIESREETHYLYQRVEQDPLLLGLLDLLRSNHMLIDFPITYGEHGVTIRVVGPEQDVQTVFE
ncbi:MAG: hypothetical protein R3324_12905, partial [Halobacteriales archaeon]|nr:hypothetical protein [Halobacteriales archaeon]